MMMEVQLRIKLMRASLFFLWRKRQQRQRRRKLDAKVRLFWWNMEVMQEDKQHFEVSMIASS